MMDEFLQRDVLPANRWGWRMTFKQLHILNVCLILLLTLGEMLLNMFNPSFCRMAVKLNKINGEMDDSFIGPTSDIPNEICERYALENPDATATNSEFDITTTVTICYPDGDADKKLDGLVTGLGSIYLPQYARIIDARLSSTTGDATLEIDFTAGTDARDNSAAKLSI